nr:MAG TPA: hypothetical protein [Caudoviricetes sp.]
MIKLVITGKEAVQWRRIKRKRLHLQILSWL